MRPFLPYSRQTIDESDIQEVIASLKQDIITRGPKVEGFEKALAEYTGAKYAVCMTSATTGLYAAFQALDVSEKDRFITSPNGFIATVAAGMRLGARPRFVDIDRSSGNLSLEKLPDLFQESTRARHIISPVHFAGIAPDMRRLDSLIKTPNTFVIEDAAQSLGSLYPDGSKVGSCPYSHMTVFSFHAVKNITTGEGGAVTTNDELLYHRLLRFRNSGIEKEPPFIEGHPEPWYYEVVELSGNFHMTEMQAALGLSQLRRLDSFIEKKRQIVSWYRKRLKNQSHIRLFDPDFDARTGYHLMVLQIDFAHFGISRTSLMQELKKAQIGTQLHFIPLYRHPILRRFGKPEDFPEMEGYYSQALSFPLFPTLSEEDVNYIIDTLLNILTK